jgi:hypothetical protein
MRLRLAALGSAVLAGLALPTTASAQVRGFTRQQQAALLVYQQQIAAQQRMQQQQQVQVLRQQLLVQQRQIAQTQQQQQQAFDLLADPYDPNVRQEDLAAMRRGTAVFGQPHYNSTLYNRMTPYYNYDFVARRNRPVPIGLNNLRGLPTSGYSGIIFGNNFGFVFPY